MNEVPVEKKRVIAVVGHHGTGKTSLLESFMYMTGETDRLGKTDDGNTFCDYLDEEKKKGMTLTSKVVQAEYEKHRLTFIDTPGYFDFVGDIKGALRVVDGAILVVNAAAGVEVETERVWEAIQERKLPTIVVVNRMDREHADFGKCLQQLRDELDMKLVPLRVPIGAEADFSGVIDLITAKALTFNEKGKVCDRKELEGDQREVYETLHEQLMDAAVETDDVLMERYLEGESISYDQVRAGIHAAAKSGDIVPVFCTSATGLIGISTLLDGIINYIPNPMERKTVAVRVGDKEDAQEITEEGAGLGLVFKVTMDPFAGQLSFIRCFSGVLPADTDLYNRTQESSVRIGHLMAISGRSHNAVNRALPGDIVAVGKVESLHAGDTLSLDKGTAVVVPVPPLPFTYHTAIHAANRNEEDKVGTGIARVIVGETTLKYERNKETREFVLSGMGDQQIELVASRLRNQLKLDVELKTPRVAYRETLTASGEGSYRHKKQSGGRGQFGEVHMRLKPQERSAGFEFKDKIFGGSIPGRFVPAVEKGVIDAMSRGVVAGYPVVDVFCELYDGKFHDVDSSEMAFKIAGSMAFRQIIADQCKPVLLEPIMDVVVTVPEQFMGDVMGDLNSRRGRVQGMDSAGRKQIIRAQVPLADMYRYPIELRSITRGRGSYVMEFAHYEQVPHDKAKEIIAEVEARKKEEEES